MHGAQEHPSAGVATGTQHARAGRGAGRRAQGLAGRLGLGLGARLGLQLVLLGQVALEHIQQEGGRLADLAGRAHPRRLVGIGYVTLTLSSWEAKQGPWRPVLVCTPGRPRVVEIQSTQQHLGFNNFKKSSTLRRAGRTMLRCRNTSASVLSSMGGPGCRATLLARPTAASGLSMHMRCSRYR